MAKGNLIASVKSEDDWQAEDDLRTLTRAEEIEKDPKRLAKVQALAKKRMLEMAAIAAEGPKD
jgi:hypothetical protein